jgi:NADPH:quinone reductase-like Zn-dependent oxidoreductase
MDVFRLAVGGAGAVAKEKLSRELGASQVALDVICVGLGDGDVRVARGELVELAPLAAPYVPGHCVCGLVKQVGGAVEHIKPEERVVGLLPLVEDGGARDRLRADALWFVRLPNGLDAVGAVAVLEPGVRALTALHYQARLLRGEVVLVLGAASVLGEVAMQLAIQRDLRVLAVVASREEATVLEARFQHRIEVFVTSNLEDELAPAVLARTNHLGVDCIYECIGVDLDAGQRRARIACLGAHAKWCVGWQLQLDPPESRALLLRGASVCFVWPAVWTLCPMQRGRYLHMVAEVLRLAAESKLSVSNIDRFALAKTSTAIDAVHKVDGSVVVVVKGQQSGSK